jgi:hypothetical protein
MPRNHPAVEEGRLYIKQSQARSDFQRYLQSKVLEDENDNQDWVKKAKYYWRRRLAQEFRRPTHPWPNSSDIVMPLMDMLIDKNKTSFTNVIWGQQLIVKFLPRSPDSVQTARNAQLFMNWFLQHQCEDLYEETDLGADRLLQYGHCVFKVFWEHRTKTFSNFIHRDQLPLRYRMVTVANMSEEDADKIALLTGGRQVPITRREFDGMASKIRRVVLGDFDLDDTEPIDKIAADKIMKFLRNPKDTGDVIQIRKRAVDYSWPKMVSVHPFDLVLPGGTRKLEHAPRITHKMRFTEEQIEQMARDRNWEEDAVSAILEGKPGVFRNAITTQDIYAGVKEYSEILEEENDKYEIWETQCFYDLDNDGHKERTVWVYSPNNKDTTLESYELELEGNSNGYVKIDFERVSEGYHDSRGIPEKVDDLDVETTVQHRNKLNRMDIANAPMLKVRAGSRINPNNIRYIPGETVNVISQQDIEPIVWPNIDVSYDREEQILRAWAEQYIGGTDFGISGPNSLQDPRTAQEIRAIESNRQNIMSTRVRAFQRKMNQVWNMMWDLMMQYPRREVRIPTGEGMPLRLTPADIAGDFDILPVGAVGFHDPVFESQKALARLQVLAQIAPIVQGDIKYDMNLGEALLAYLESEDIVQAGLILRRRSDQEIQQIQQQQAERQRIIDQVESNVPTSPEDLITYANDIQRRLPHGRVQRVGPSGSRPFGNA